ncbi:Dual specificity protein phosphatase 10-like [Oopsacas minuta]|uniref:protein-tyrosine-phosphatase n=1 Tax=Oopsacas minuta TaxID=111878 RepID=A0AAV7KJN5_9METZ|nr:Dual specificity protein phosphatase 10-like [Oopsacas minuta]
MLKGPLVMNGNLPRNEIVGITTSTYIVPSIRSRDVAEMIQNEKELILIDCRNENEFSQTHVKNAVLLNNNPLMVKRFLKGSKQLSDLLLVSKNANEIVSKMEKIQTIFYDSGSIQGSMKDILQHLVVKKNLNVKAMEGGFQEFSSTYQDLCTDPCLESRDSGENLLSYCNVISTAEWEKAPPAKILPHLVLGNVYDADNKQVLQKLNVGYIINVSEHIPFKFEKDFKYFRVPTKDNTGANLTTYFNGAFEFIETARTKGSVVFIHCHAGISRSVSITIAYMIKYYKMGLYQAYNFIKARRPCVAPNLNFMGQLLAFEKQVREEELKTPVQHKNMDSSGGASSGDSISLVSKLINIPSMVNSSLDEDYVTMDETPKLEENSFGSVFESNEKLNLAPKLKIPPQFAPYAPGSKYQTNQIQVYLTQTEWNDLEYVGKHTLSPRNETQHPVPGERRGSVARMVDSFEHHLQTNPTPNLEEV